MVWILIGSTFVALLLMIVLPILAVSPTAIGYVLFAYPGAVRRLVGGEARRWDRLIVFSGGLVLTVVAVVSAVLCV